MLQKFFCCAKKRKTSSVKEVTCSADQRKTPYFKEVSWSGDKRSLSCHCVDTEKFCAVLNICYNKPVGSGT